MTVSDTNKPTVDWQRLWLAHERRLQPFKTSRWKKPTPEEEAEKKQALDECALEAAHAQLTHGFDSFKPGVVWSRPAVIPEDDSVLIWHLRVSAGSRAARASREIATDFWRWRWHVLDVEREDGAKLQVLMRAIVGLLAVRDGLGVELAKTHVDFVHAHYGHAIGATHAPKQLPDELPNEREQRAEFQRLVYQLVRREQVLPTWLAWFGSVQLPPGVRPRGPMTTTQAKEDRDGADDEEADQDW